LARKTLIIHILPGTLMKINIRALEIPQRFSAGVAFLLLFLLVGSASAIAQVSTKVAFIAPDAAIANSPITITIQLQQGESIQRAYIVYRPFGESEYQKAEMDLLGNTANVTLPSRVVTRPYIEYYIVLQNRTGGLETYPLSETPDPFTTPPGKTLRLLVRAEDQSETQVVFLSPDPNSAVQPDEALISLSLLRTDSTIIRKATQVFLDGANVTKFLVFSGDILVLPPDNLGRQLAPGPHRVSVRLFDRTGNLAAASTVTFTVQGGGTFAYSEPITAKFKYGVNVNFESRHEQVDNEGMWYNRGGYNFTGTLNDWRFKSNLFVTSDETNDRQPQNRFYLGVDHPLAYAGYGDSYPSFPNLILSGKRVRGFTAGVRFGVFNLDFVYGQTTREVEGKILKSFPKDSIAVEQQKDSTSAYGPIPGDATRWGKYSYGTYAKDLFAIRPSFGSGETWQLGLTVLKSKDDIGSINYGIRPDENIVFGSDFVARLDSRRIEVSAQAAFSAYNADISSGSFTDAQIDSLRFITDKGAAKNIRDILSRYVTVNENFRPLSSDLSGVLAYDATLSLHYFGNVFRFMYLYRGNDYNSAGQTYLRKDVAGFNISDRMRIIDNQMFISLGYERLQDNTGGTKIATTTFGTINAAVSYYPLVDAPNVTIGYSRFDNDNGLSLRGPDSLSVVADVTNQIYLQSSYDFTFGARHTAAFSASISSRDDKSYVRANVTSNTFTIGLSSRYSIPLQTNLDIAFNINQLPTGTPGVLHDLDYTALTARGRYALITDILWMAAAVSPTFGDFKRTVFDISSEYYPLPTMSFTLQFDYFVNDGAPNDNFVSLRYRYDI
jgi:hypothetical protein